GSAATEGAAAAARTVSVPKPETQIVLTDIISGLAGACPSLTFTVAGTAVVTSAATTYASSGACADVKNGDKRGVAGTMQEGKLAATYVSGAISTDVTVTGAASGVTGTCPALTLTIGSKTVLTTSSTT